MGNAQKLMTLWLLFPTVGLAAWQTTFNRWGYFGDFGVGAIYEWHERQSAELSLGTYQVAESSASQINLAYRTSPWSRDEGGWLWRPLEVGLFAVWTMDREKYFLESPPRYPVSEYYDQTALRWGMELGSKVQFPALRISFAYHLRILDSGLIADYNNAHKDLVYHVSSGISVRILH